MNIRQMINECVRNAVHENLKERHMSNRIDSIIAEEIKHFLNEDKDMKRNAVKSALKDPKYNHAQLAYRLWPDMDKDTARSLFAKMANGTPDNDGVVRNFSEEDINTLYQLIRKR